MQLTIGHTIDNLTPLDTRDTITVKTVPTIRGVSRYCIVRKEMKQMLLQDPSILAVFALSVGQIVELSSNLRTTQRELPRIYQMHCSVTL